MPYYEHVFIARQDISHGQVETLRDTFKKVISDNGGKTTKEEYWGLRTLAYKIKKNRKGHYTLMQMDCPAPALQEMERQMRLNEDVLRHLTIKIEELDNKPSIMMQSDKDKD